MASPAVIQNMRALLPNFTLIAFAAITIASEPAPAAAGTADDWLASLYDDVAADLTDGKPLVVHAHVPLCDNNIIRCGRRGLGDGDNPKTNLYWATSGGFIGWFGRRGASVTIRSCEARSASARPSAPSAAAAFPPGCAIRSA